MIADFRYESTPKPDCVQVKLFWDRGRRAGLVHIPRVICEELAENDWPAAIEPLSIDGALAYGLMLSMRAGISLRVSGDQSVWPEEWGLLISSH